MLDVRIIYPAIANNGNGHEVDANDDDDDDEGTCEGDFVFIICD